MSWGGVYVPKTFRYIIQQDGARNDAEPKLGTGATVIDRAKHSHLYATDLLDILNFEFR
jgi:hypothetical protein